MGGQTARSTSPISLRVPFHPSAVKTARQELKRWMADRGGTRESIEDAQIVISELVGNAVRHARALPGDQLSVTWSVERRGLHLTVTDGGGQTVPQQYANSATALSGRGLTIVDALSHSWWVEDTRCRSSVHVILALATA